MSVEHMAMVFAADGMDGSEKLLLLAYTNFTDAHGYCWPGEERLATITGTSVSTVRRTKKKLVGRNLMKSMRRAETSNLARVNLPLLASMARPRKAFDDNEMERLSFKDASDPSETGSDQETGQSDTSGEAAPDLHSSQSDTCHRSDCSVGGCNMTCGPGQSDTQSSSEPSVDPSAIPQSLDGRRHATSGSSGKGSGGSAASIKSKFRSLTERESQAYASFVQALPLELAALVPKNAPRDLKLAVVEALDLDGPAGRTVEQLIAYRMMPKWDKYYSSRSVAGSIVRPVGVLRAMLRRDAECGDERCEERVNVDTGAACRACEMRAVDHRADRENAKEGPPMPEASATVPAPRPVAPAGPPRDDCGNCGDRIMVVGPALKDGLCATCRRLLALRR